jgi:hypothetical protein
MVLGPYQSGNVEGKALVEALVRPQSGPSMVPIYPKPGGPIPPGPISDPSWNPGSDGLAFAMGVSEGKSDICTVNSDGADFKNLTKGQGDFRSPKISPQTQ